ncbi:MAG: glycosyltransferase, partial [Acidobacteria bacterium]|nr:glycosyltransferase [Acidobacteriota bacterium]
MNRSYRFALIGLGAYSSVPAAMAAAVVGVPVFLLEQNVIPGKANKMLSRWATEIYAQWEESKQYFVRPERVRVMGNPVRVAVTLVAAALFAVHPVAGEPVNYVSSRSESLAALFVMGALLLHLRVGEDRRWWVGSLSMFLAGLLTKA